MREEMAQEFYDIACMLETLLYALKWQNYTKNVLAQDYIIHDYEYILKKLKVCCINNFGLPEDV